jgi:translation initiation factor 5B
MPSNLYFFKVLILSSFNVVNYCRYAVILAFDVKIERDAQEMADSVGVKIFQADIIYHLFDSFMKYRDELKAKKREEFKDVAVFPCKLRILPQVTLGNLFHSLCRAQV